MRQSIQSCLDSKIFCEELVKKRKIKSEDVVVLKDCSIL